jgi:hypothetical protein
VRTCNSVPAHRRLISYVHTTARPPLCFTRKLWCFHQIDDDHCFSRITCSVFVSAFLVSSTFLDLLKAIKKIMKTENKYPKAAKEVTVDLLRFCTLF